MKGVAGTDRYAVLTGSMLAYALERQSRYAEAMARYEALIRQGLGQDPILYHHGLCAYRLGRYADAIRSWTDLHGRVPGGDRLEPLIGSAYRARALQLANGGDFAAVSECLDAAEVFAPAGAVLPELYLHAAARALTRGDRSGRDEARRYLTTVQSAAGDDRRPARYLALLDALDGAPERAVARLRRILSDEPEDRAVRLAYALSWLPLGDADRAERVLADLAGDGSGPVPIRAARSLAALRIRQGRWDAAAWALDALPGDDPWRVRIRPECWYRAGRFTDLAGPTSAGSDQSLWAALARWGSEPVQSTVATFGSADPGTGDRARRELALALTRAALTEADEGRWDAAATLLYERQRLGLGPSASPYLDAVILGFGGHRTEGVQVLADASRAAPAEHRLTHALALMLLHTVSGPGSDPPRAAALHRQCIAAWAAILHDQEFWQGWAARRAHRYGTPVPEAYLSSLRGRVRTHLEHALGPVDGTEILLHREVDAAQALAGCGGFPVGQAPGRVLVCGPLRIADLGLAREFGSFVAEKVDWADAAQLRGYFSQLGFAEVHRSAGRAREAVDALADLRCDGCRARPVDRRATGPGQPMLCVRDCAHFDEYNAAYAQTPDKHLALLEDALDLSVAALLELARTALTAETPDLTGVGSHWRQAVERARLIDAAPDVQDAVADMALGRAAALERADRLDDAIALIDEARRHCGGVAGERLNGQLATLLASRGIRAGNAEPARMADAAADLRRAIEVNPHLRRARVNLPVALRELALDRVGRGDPVAALDLLRESVRVLEAGLADEPGQPELLTALGIARADLQDLTAELLRLISGPRRR